MSTNAECGFTEVTPGVWYYKLQHPPYGDTMDFSDFGPFDTYKIASEHLHDHHANPGGHWMEVHEDHVHDYADVSYKSSGVTGYLANSTWTQHECVGCGEETPEARQTARDERRVQDIARMEDRLATLKAEAAAAIRERDGGE